MEKSLSIVKGYWAKSFWNSKLGQAAIASIVAMSAMVIVTTQFGPGEAHAATMAQPGAHGVVLVEIA
ncbi:hypothetical protein [Erythrobacter sp. THAF29]|uniref:hypothetical protein n=1 Tax=Erythrobacter sp. THAF29 TaxID=2587851 RepID=UPI001267FB2B|nr:hypothetical protein [Erythrobacter sp. THAF29]QFT78566.1 hypothetical protein FIU90_13535 [Erythrobacter sp. THAF29]